jgi:hypothetical protein
MLISEVFEYNANEIVDFLVANGVGYTNDAFEEKRKAEGMSYGLKGVKYGYTDDDDFFKFGKGVDFSQIQDFYSGGF